MYKAAITILLFFIIVLAGCSNIKEPVVKLGKTFDKTKLEVSQETDVFNIYDNFAYSLSYGQPFGIDTINRRLYKGKEYIDLILKENSNIKLKPDTKIIGESFPVRNIVNKYGSGNFMLLFVVNDVVIAKKPFSIRGYERMTNNAAENKVYDEIMPERPNRNTTIQPDVMTRDQKPDDLSNERKTSSDTFQPEAVRKEQKPPEEMIQKKPARNMVSPSEMMGND